MIRDVDRKPIITHRYPGYPFKNERRRAGPYTIEDYGDTKHVWRHGWRKMDEDGISVIDEVRNVCRRLRSAERLPC